MYGEGLNRVLLKTRKSREEERGYLIDFPFFFLFRKNIRIYIILKIIGSRDSSTLDRRLNKCKGDGNVLVLYSKIMVIYTLQINSVISSMGPIMLIQQ